MRVFASVIAAAALMLPRPAVSQDATRVPGWRSDIDSLVQRIDKSHPNPWRHRARTNFMAEARALADSVPALSDGRVLTGIMRLVASLGDGHTGVTDVGTAAGNVWFPIRFALFADGLWVTAIVPESGAAVGKRVLNIGGRPADEVIGRLLAIAHGDNIFNRRQHSAMLSNGLILNALGLARREDTLEFEVAASSSRKERVRLAAGKGNGSLAWEQFGEMYAPPGLAVTTAFSRLPSAFLDPAANADLPLHMRGRRAYWWRYLPDSRTLYFQLNAVAAQSRHSKETLLQTWTNALSQADSTATPISRLVLDVRYNSGGDGSLVPAMVRALIKRDSALARPGRFFVITGGKTFSAATDLVGELLKYLAPIVVGEPPGAGLNASGDAGSIRLPYSGVSVSVSTRYTQSVRPRAAAATVIPVNVPAPMRGEDYFRGTDPSLDAILSQPDPYPNVTGLLRDSGGVAARRFWKTSNARYGKLEWWEPWRWQVLNSVSYELLEAGRTEDAIAGFEINTERNPQIWETWDSLGEGYLKAGRKDDALRSYERALAIDPANWNAAEQRRVVAELRGGRTR